MLDIDPLSTETKDNPCSISLYLPLKATIFSVIYYTAFTTLWKTLASCDVCCRQDKNQLPTYNVFFFFQLIVTKGYNKKQNEKYH